MSEIAINFAGFSEAKMPTMNTTREEQEFGLKNVIHAVFGSWAGKSFSLIESQSDVSSYIKK